MKKQNIVKKYDNHDINSFFLGLHHSLSDK